MEPIISVRGLGKSYRIQTGERKPYRTLRDDIADFGKGLLKGQWGNSQTEEFWALKDIDLDINPGEVVGIIGRNGAGKSTFLKVLSRVVQPTEGEAILRGRVASLLEVGTGFHPELTGRENIFISGAVLGMKSSEVKRKFDEIVEFAEVEKFLELPVKKFSSGMYVRLAFAVAAHLETDILLVDEVLAVGDAAFQKKCLGKMENVAQKEGRTVLLVSHNMASILSLCREAYWLDKGRVSSKGKVSSIMDAYMASMTSLENIPLNQRHDRSGEGGARFTSVTVKSTDPSGVIRCDSHLEIILRYCSKASLNNVTFAIGIYDYSNVEIYLLDSDGKNEVPETLASEGEIKCIVGPINLTPGQCYLNLALVKGGLIEGGSLIDYVQNAINFSVEPTDFYGSGKLPPRNWSLCVIPHHWSIK
jgi:lipopolysaccharide transport system ATP-binding protein